MLKYCLLAFKKSEEMGEEVSPDSLCLSTLIDTFDHVKREEDYQTILSWQKSLSELSADDRIAFFNLILCLKEESISDEILELISGV
jgi:hypothetical protein